MSQPQFQPLELNPTTGEPFLRLPSPHSNIILTPPRMSDAPAIVSHMNDPKVYYWLEGPPFPYLPEHAEQWLAKVKNGTDAVLQVLQRASEEDPHAPPILVSEPPVRTLREVREDGTDVFLGDIAILRERWPDMDDGDAKNALKQPNADKELGDPEIIWCIGGEHAAVLPSRDAS